MLSGSVLQALRGIADRAHADVSAVRRAFTSGVPPLKTIGSGSVSDVIVRNADSDASRALLQGTSRFGVVTAPVGSPPSPPTPELDRVEVGIDRKIGTVDSFCATIVSSLAADEVPSPASILIFRANLGSISVPRPTNSALSQLTPENGTRKNLDPIAIAAFQGDRLGVGTKLTTIVADDHQIGSRVVRVSGTQLPALHAYVNVSRASGPGTLMTAANLDPSVSVDTAFYINRRTLGGLTLPSLPLSTGDRSGINVLGGNSITAGGGIIQPGNFAGYQLVGSIPLGDGRKIGSFAEFSFVDGSVVHGNRYAYFVVCESKGVRGLRSRIVVVDMANSIPPTSPKVSYVVVGSTPRFTLSVTGDADHVEVFRRGGDVPDSVQILSIDGALVSDSPPMRLPNGFNHIGDIGLGPDRSVSFVDTGVRPGHAADYRFYTVGAFGLKSQSPTTCSLRLSEFGIGIPLSIPSITAEQAVGAPRIHITVECQDGRASFARVNRRTLTQGENGFHSPSEPPDVSLGTARGAKRAMSRRGPTYVGPDSWSGILQLISGTAQMDDTTVQYDRVYQYSVVAIAGRGLESSAATSDVLRVTTRAVVDPPIGLKVGLATGIDGSMGIMTQWSGSTSDFSPSQLIGSQADLTDSSVRTVFQLERKGSDGRWVSLPATTGTSFFDPVSDAPAPPYRPAYAKLLETYQYRVISMQSGGFLSMRSDPVTIIAEPSVSPPSSAWVRSTSTGVRPIGIVVSWDDGQPAVDRWQIERAHVNKVFGSKITSVDSPAVHGLDYVRVADVTREAATALPVSSDPIVRDPAVYIGSSFYFDPDVDLANTYFYRVRSVLPSGRESDWVYLGISLNDSAFDRKFYSTLSDSDRSSLVNDKRPIVSTGVE